MTKLFERSEMAKNLSDKSFKMANDAYQNASFILNTLENFKEVIAANKEKAEKAENLKSEINANLEDSRALFNKINTESMSIKQNLSASQVDLNTAIANLEKADKVT